jgi:hypothetical protein
MIGYDIGCLEAIDFISWDESATLYCAINAQESYELL